MFMCLLSWGVARTSSSLSWNMETGRLNAMTHKYSAPKSWRKPSFVAEPLTPTQYGNIVHKAMQHLPFRLYSSVQDVATEIQNLVRQQYLSAEMACLIDHKQLFDFFTSKLGQKAISSGNVLREFKFSILDDADHFGCAGMNDQVLLQGVIDCAVIEEDGITVIDFKTDRVTEKTLETVAEQYRQQVITYANAISRIYQKEIKNVFLYFFEVSKAYEVI